MKYPFAPLTEALGPVYQINRGANGNIDDGYRPDAWCLIGGNPIGIISELTGLSRRRLTRWARDGVPEDQADRLAVALGFHPAAIWPNEWFDSRGNVAPGVYNERDATVVMPAAPLAESTG